MGEIIARIIKDEISSNSSKAVELQKLKGFGERINEKVFYFPEEAFFLLESKKLSLKDYLGREIPPEKAKAKISRIKKNFHKNYLVFKDLRKKGYILKPGLKFGADYRVYEKNSKIKKTHSKWLLTVADESEKIKMTDFAGKNRVAHSTNKKLLIAIVDGEKKISYFEVSWIKP